MNQSIKFRLSTMMFIQFIAGGAVIPVISLYLKQSLGFTGTQIGTLFAAASVSSLISPLIGIFIADRFIRAKHLLALCHLGCAVTIGLFSQQTAHTPAFVLYLIYSLLFGPTFSLTNAITFHNTTDAHKTFGRIRLWGTAGWVAVAWMLLLYWSEVPSTASGSRLGDALVLASISSFILAIYSLTLPSPRIRMSRNEGFVPTASINVIKKKNVFLLVVIAFTATFIERFHFIAVSPFLKNIGFPESSIMPAMSIGQITEIIAIALTGTVITRFGFGRVIVFGVAIEALRFILYFTCNPALVRVALGIHGMTFAFIFMTISIFIDAQCSAKARTGVQLIIAFVTGGIAGILGALLCGALMDRFASGDVPNYQLFWGVPSVMAILMFIICAVFLNRSWRARVTGLVSWLWEGR